MLYSDMFKRKMVQRMSGPETISAVREEDRDENPIEMAIPMPIPKGDAWREWDKVNRFYVAPAGSLSYDDFRGAEWR